MELKDRKGETKAQLAARQARQDADDKKFAARDPNISSSLHERFEAIEARLDALEAGRRLPGEPAETYEQLHARLSSNVKPAADAGGDDEPAESGDEPADE